MIAFDNVDIIQKAPDIGLYQQCAQIKEYCQIVPQKPVTACTPRRAAEEMVKLDLSLLDKQFAERKVLTLLQLNGAELLSQGVFKDSIPDDSVVIDCQTEDQFERFHDPRAKHWDFYDLLAKYRGLSKDKTYLIYCTFGMQSAVLAEKMQSDGYLAYSLRGGIKQLA